MSQPIVGSLLNEEDTIRFFIQKLKNLDLGCIAYKLIVSGFSKEQTVKLITQYMMFLSLIYLYPNVELIPTREIDQVWHSHILDTEKYALDCQMLFGRFIHHFPYLSPNDQNDQDLQETWEQTQQLFSKHFGQEAIMNFKDNKNPSVCKLKTKGNLQRPTVDLPEINILLS